MSDDEGATMAKGYWVGNTDIHDFSGMPAYAEANRGVMARHGARFVTRGGSQSVVEGAGRSRVTIVEFPSYEAATSCYHDPEYQAAAKLRHAISEGTMIIVEGYDEPSEA